VVIESGAVVAFLGADDALVFDPLADTEEALGMVDHSSEMAALGLTSCAVALIAAMPCSR
jgi:hypothetical protein